LRTKAAEVTSAVADFKYDSFVRNRKCSECDASSQQEGEFLCKNGWCTLLQ
jgi:hypothetical protein